MIVDLISKTSLDEGSNPSISTKHSVCKVSKKAVRFNGDAGNQSWTIKQTCLLSLGMTGFDSLPVWIKEIVAAYKRQINQHVSASFKESCVDRSPGCDIPGFFITANGMVLYAIKTSV